MRSQFVLPALLLVSGALWGAGWLLGSATGLALAVVCSSPLIAMAAAPLIRSTLGRSAEVLRRIVYQDIEGRHFAYKGRSILVHEDLGGDRWLRAGDIRKIVVDLPRDQVWRRVAPDDLGTVDSSRELFIRARALDDYLGKSHAQPTIRFRRWLQREVIFPSQRAGRHGAAGSPFRDTAPPGAG